MAMPRTGRLRGGLVLLVLLGLTLGGCAGHTGGEPRRAVDDTWPPLVFQLGAVEIVDETPAEPASADLAGAFSIAPDQALRNWAALRLRSRDGAPGVLRFHMTSAEAERTPLVGTPGIKGWFTRDQAERVTITLAGRLEARRNDGSLIASATAQAGAHRTFAEKTDPAARRAGLDELLATALAAFDREIEARAKADMADVVE